MDTGAPRANDRSTRRTAESVTPKRAATATTSRARGRGTSRATSDRKRRTDVGQTHRQPHKALMKAATDWCVEWNIPHQADKVVYTHAVGKAGHYWSTQQPGFPDMFIFRAGKEGGEQRHGLAIEFKIGADTLHLAQVKWFERLRKDDYR